MRVVRKPATNATVSARSEVSQLESQLSGPKRMEFASELNKPLFVCRPERVYALYPDVVKDALANNTAVRGRFVGRLLLKVAAARRMTWKALIPLDDADPVEVKELVVSRLEADATETFEYVDGRTFTGAEAAMEVCKRSAIGEFFMELEKETLRRLQAAFQRGDFEPIETRRLLAYHGPRAVLQLPWA